MLQEPDPSTGRDEHSASFLSVEGMNESSVLLLIKEPDNIDAVRAKLWNLLPA